MVRLSPYKIDVKDEKKTYEELIDELASLREQVDVLKKNENRYIQLLQSNQSVKDALSRFEAVIENTPMVAIQGFNRDGVICHWNRACQQLYGYSPEEAVGKRMQDIIIQNEDIEQFNSAIEEIIRTGKPLPCITWKLKTKSGDRIWAYSSMFPIFEQGKIVEIFCMDVDITARKKLEESLQQGEEQLRTLINAMPDIVCFKDGEGRWLEANDFDLRLFELENTSYRGKKDSELAKISEHYRDAFLKCEETDEMAWRSKKICRNEETIRKPDGTLMTFETIKVPLYYPDGSRKGLVILGRDITERKIAENRLKKAYESLEIMVEERTKELLQAKNTMQAIIETVPIGVVMAEKNPDRITYFSKNAIDILGGDISSTSFDKGGPIPYKIFKPDGSIFDQDKLPLQRSLREGVYFKNVEAKICRKDGSEVLILISSAPVFDTSHNIIAAVACLIDVTELKEASNALKESERFLNNILDGIQDGISVLDKDMNIIRVNHAMEKWYQQMMPLEGKKCYYAYHKRQKPCEICPSIRTFRTGAIQCDIIKDTHGWTELYSFPIMDKDGHVSGIIEHVRDITDRKKAEDELLEAKSQAELYLDLMGHDINNINQVAMGYLEMAGDILNKDSEAKKFIQKPLEMLKSSSKLIDNVMKLKLARAKEIMFTRIEIGKILDELKEEYSSVKGKEITINIKKPDRIFVNANELLRDVFSNLIGNAIKHSLPGKPVKIDINIEKKMFDNTGHYMIAIEDNGPGIPDSMKSSIFDRLRRGTTDTSGKGIGLYLVKTLVENFNGRVWVEDRVAGDNTKGCKFVIMLPSA